MPKAIFYLLKGDYKGLELRAPRSEADATSTNHKERPRLADPERNDEMADCQLKYP